MDRKPGYCTVQFKLVNLPGVLRLLMKEFFGVASSSSKSNSVGVGGLGNKDVCISDTFCRCDKNGKTFQ